MATKADQYRANALHEVGEDYVWGAEGTGGVEGDDDYDCSGFAWAMLNDVGVTVPRVTANDYYRMATPVGGPEKVGADYGFHVDATGHATHIIPFIGRGETVEAKGRAYGVVRGTVAAATAAGTVWRRLPNVDLGDLTEAVPAPTQPQYPGYLVHTGHTGWAVRWVQKRLREKGYVLAVDGVFGPQTKDRVQKFQRAQKVAVDGVVGPVTWGRLRR